MARRGARNVGDDEARPASASDAWRAAMDAARRDAEPPTPEGRGRTVAERAEWLPDDDDQAGPVRDEAERAVARGTAPSPDAPGRSAPRSPRTRGPADRPPGGGRRTVRVEVPTPGNGAARRKAPVEVRDELVKAVGSSRAPRLEERLMDAARAFSRERYRDAVRVLRPLAEEAPGAGAVRELHGLALYRLGRWRDAVKELEAFRTLTGSYDQHPVLADCRRALGQHRQVAALWDELREASPGAELVTEGRIVAAGSLADRGDVDGAIRLLERGPLRADRPKGHHLRLWYALADLYERAGEVPKARDLFQRVAAHEADFADVAERLGGLA